MMTGTFTGYSDTTNIINGTFFRNSGVDIVEVPIRINYGEWIMYIVLVLLALIAVTWYFAPERIRTILYFSVGKAKQERKGLSVNPPGIVINTLMFLNYLIALTIFIFLVTKQFLPLYITRLSTEEFIVSVTAIILAVFFYRLIHMAFSGFIFNTQTASHTQIAFYRKVNFSLGILLVPMIFFIILTGAKFLLAAGLIILLSAQILKWVQTFFIGISIPGFSVFHLIMYLCTLEIIPVVVLIRLLDSSFS